MRHLTRALIVVIGCLMVATGVWAESMEHFAYITNYNSGTVSFIDTDTRAVIRTVTVGALPYGVAIAPGGSTLYVTNYGSGTVSAINTADGTVWDTITTGGHPTGIVVDNKVAYVADYAANKLHLIETWDGKVWKSVAVGNGPMAVAIHPQGQAVYVANYLSNTVQKVRYDGVLIGSGIAVGTNPNSLVFHPSGSSLWVTNNGSDSVSVINLYDNSVTTIPVGDGPMGICFNRSGTYAYVANYYADTVSVIKVATKAVTATIPVGNGPFGVAMDRSDHHLYVANYYADNVSVIDTTTNSIIAIIPVGDGPLAVGQFVSASAFWTSAVSTSLRVTYLEEDAKGNVKAKNATQSLEGTCSLLTNYRKPVEFYCIFTNGASFFLYNVTHFSAENPKSKTEQVTMNGTGYGDVILPTNRRLPGFAYFEGKGTLKKPTVGGEVTSISLSGKVTIHGDTGVLGTGTMRLDFSKP